MKTILASMFIGAAVVTAAEPAPKQLPQQLQQQAQVQSQPQPRVLKTATGGSVPLSRNSAVINPEIDYEGFQKISQEVQPIRKERRLTEEKFAAMAAGPGTIVLDARSADKYEMRHIRGAVSLPFTEFTAETLAKVIPAKDTRVLIYCNNNFTGAPREFASKAAPASLNISTYIALATYGYTNIYELGPLLDVKTTKLPFVGTEVVAKSVEVKLQ